MTSCRYLSEREILKLSDDRHLSAHLNQHFVVYLTISDSTKLSLKDNNNFSTFELIKMISQNIEQQGSYTQIYALEANGFKVAALSGLFARLCWEFRALPDEVKRKIGLLKFKDL